MRFDRSTIARAALLVVAFGPLGSSAAAQRAPTLAGAEARMGLAFPEQASAAGSAFGELDIGHFRTPELRALFGLSYFRANIDREPGNDEGSFRATGIWLAGRYDVFRIRAVAPYVRGGLTFHSVNADAWDVEAGRLLDGLHAGVAAAAGFGYALDAWGRLNATAELRRTFMTHIGNTALEVGVRYQRRGWRAYIPEPVPIGAPRPPGTPPPPPSPPPTEVAEAPVPGAIQPGPIELDPFDQGRAAEAARAARAAEEQARAAQRAEAERAERESLAATRLAAAEAMLRQSLTRAAAAMTSVAGFVETPAGFVVTIGGNAFGSGAPTLSARARGEIRVLATVLAGYAGHIISVEGHTDAVGNASANQHLSEERAAAVRAALIAEGVDPLWIGSVGWGPTLPVASNDTAAGRAANRRVEVHIEKRPCTSPPAPEASGRLVCPL